MDRYKEPLPQGTLYGPIRPIPFIIPANSAILKIPRVTHVFSSKPEDASRRSQKTVSKIYAPFST